jgi:glutathione S-transferase
MMKLVLYHHSTSVCSAKVRLALCEKRLAWEGCFVDILAGHQFDETYRRLNPRMLVPALVDGDAVVIESTVINEYLDETYPEVRLTPARPVDRASMRVWTKTVDERLHDACTVITYVAQHRHRLLSLSDSAREEIFAQTPDPVFRERKRRWVTDGVDAPDLSQALRVYDRMLGDMERSLSSGPWLAGEAYSLADIGMAPYVNRLAMLQFDEMWSERPGVARWFERLRQRPAFPQAVTKEIPAALTAEMAQRGREIWPAMRAVWRRG